MKPKQLIPKQETGAERNYATTKEFQDAAAARAAYHEACLRMLNPAGWHSYHGMAVSGRFMVCDDKGNVLNETPQPGNFLKLSLPAPGNPSSGNGHDWVRVEQIDVDTPIDGGIATAMTVRAAADPTAENSETAHFFAETATSTFSIALQGTTVTASIDGRNEQPNTDTKGIAGKVRNAVVAIGAMLGFSQLQWKPLTAGFMEGPAAAPQH